MRLLLIIFPSGYYIRSMWRCQWRDCENQAEFRLFSLALYMYFGIMGSRGDVSNFFSSTHIVFDVEKKGGL